jgi:outer membrane protein OmpA-like peptidoglycan-associated protein
MEMIRGRTLDEVRRYDWFKALVALALFLFAYFICGKWDAAPAAPAAPVAIAEVAKPAAVAPAGALVSVTKLAFNWADGKLVLTGAVKDQATKAALVAAAVKQMGGDASKVVDQLTIDSTTSALGFMDKLGDVFAWGSNGRGIQLDGDKVTLTGVVPVEGDKIQKGEAAARYFGSAVKIDNQISVQAPAKVEPAKLYFATGKFSVQADAKEVLAKLIAYGNASPNAKLQITGYHDKRGNPEANKELAKNRAKAVRDVLKSAGLAEDRFVMVPPVETTGGADDNEARRVEVTVAQ